MQSRNQILVNCSSVLIEGQNLIINEEIKIYTPVNRKTFKTDTVKLNEVTLNINFTKIYELNINMNYSICSAKWLYN